MESGELFNKADDHVKVVGLFEDVTVKLYTLQVPSDQLFALDAETRTVDGIVARAVLDGVVLMGAPYSSYTNYSSSAAINVEPATLAERVEYLTRLQHSQELASVNATLAGTPINVRTTLDGDESIEDIKNNVLGWFGFAARDCIRSGMTEFSNGLDAAAVTELFKKEGLLE